METKQEIKVEHITIHCSTSADAAHRKLLEIVPRLDPKLMEMLSTGDKNAVADQIATGPKLWLFEIRDHGSLLAIDGKKAVAYQYEIGNPITAESMTRHHLSAGLYAPLRVLLSESENGLSKFEYDLPSSLFGQFGVDAVTQVGKKLDQQLQEVLLEIANNKL